MGSGQSNQTKVVKLNIHIIQLSEERNNPTVKNFMYEGSQKLMVSEPFSLVKSNYAYLKNIYNDQKQDDLISGIKVVHGLVGLQNLGNTCYFNTALHCLANTQPLMDYFLSKLHENEINKNNLNGTKGEVSTMFGKLISELWRGSRSVGIIKGQSDEKVQLKGKSRESSYSPSKSNSSKHTKQALFQESISPKDLITTVNKYSKMFAIGQQEDCQELLAYLLDMVHEDLNRCAPLKVPLPPERDYYGKDVQEEWAAESWSRHLKTSKSVVVDVFQGQLKSTLQCIDCGIKSHKFEAFLFLSLPIPKPQVSPDLIEESKFSEQLRMNSIRLCKIESHSRSSSRNRNEIPQDDSNQFIRQSLRSPTYSSMSPSRSGASPYSQSFTCSLQECLALFSTEETLSGSSQWNCPQCKHSVDATKRIQLWKLPNVLIIHFKRFEYAEGGGKIDAVVQFPIDDLDLSEFVCSPQKESPLYTLYAVAQHQGSMERGHYTAAAKNRNDGQWYWYNDHQVMQIIDINTLIVNQYAYVLFYQKKTSESIFRQTLSSPDKWPHFTSSSKRHSQMDILVKPSIEIQQFSQTQPIRLTPLDKNLLIIDDYIDGTQNIIQSDQLSENCIGSPQLDFDPDQEIPKKMQPLRISHSLYFNNVSGKRVEMGDSQSRRRDKNKHIAKQSQDSIFAVDMEETSRNQDQDLNQPNKDIIQFSDFKFKTVKMSDQFKQKPNF